MDSDQGKLFIGGISWETNEDKLTEHFQTYGNVLQTVVMRDKMTGKPRGFGFVVFSDPNVLDIVLQDTHVIDGRTVEAKRAMSREEQQVSKVSGGRGVIGSTRTKKIFVGGLPQTINEDVFREYFETYGMVTDVVIMYDQQTSRPRGFGFVSFDSEDAVDRVLHKTFHDLDGKQVEVKRALPKDANSFGGGNNYNNNRSMGYQPSYDTYAHQQQTYGNPNTGRGGGGGMGYQAQTGYGYQGYGYGTTSQWGNTNASGNQSTIGYGNQGYGYGGGSEGGYGPRGGPNVGGYGDGSGNAGYGITGWRTDPTQGGSFSPQTSGYHGGQVGYGGGYGGGSAWAPQQQ